MSNALLWALALGVGTMLFDACSRPESVSSTPATQGSVDLELSDLFIGDEPRVDLGNLSASGWEAVGPGPDLTPAGPVVLTQSGALLWSASESRLDFQLAKYVSGRWVSLPSLILATVPEPTVLWDGERVVIIGLSSSSDRLVVYGGRGLEGAGWEELDDLSGVQISAINGTMTPGGPAIWVRSFDEPINEWPSPSNGRVLLLAESGFVEIPPPPLKVSSGTLVWANDTLVALGGPAMTQGVVAAPAEEAVQVAILDVSEGGWQRLPDSPNRGDLARAAQFMNGVVLVSSNGSGALLDLGQETWTQLDQLPPCETIELVGAETAAIVQDCFQLFELTRDSTDWSEISWPADEEQSIGFARLAVSDDGVPVLVTSDTISLYGD